MQLLPYAATRWLEIKCPTRQNAITRQYINTDFSIKILEFKGERYSNLGNLTTFRKLFKFK